MQPYRCTNYYSKSFVEVSFHRRMTVRVLGGRTPHLACNLNLPFPRRGGGGGGKYVVMTQTN